MKTANKVLHPNCRCTWAPMPPSPARIELRLAEGKLAYLAADMSCRKDALLLVTQLEWHGFNAMLRDGELKERKPKS